MKKLANRSALKSLSMILSVIVGVAWSSAFCTDRARSAEKASVGEAKQSGAATQADRKTARQKKDRPAREKRETGRKKKDVQRFGSVIELRPEKKDYYIELHANTWPSVLEQIRESNIRNYSIYLAELEGKLYLFSYFEYVGDDFEADMAKIAEDPETQRWWKETDPCQKRLPGTPEGEQWLRIPEVFHTN